jgi:hypothetical protein
MKRTRLIGLSFLLVSCMMAATSYGQVVTTPGAIWESTGAGAQGGRSPGQMVGDGLVRAAGLMPDALAYTEITEMDAPSLRTQLMVEAVDTFFRDLNTALVLYQNVILGRAGRTPVIPSSVLPTTSGGDLDLSDLSSLIDRFSGLSR